MSSPRLTSTSSQDEYDESESESDDDHVLTSSNEHVHASFVGGPLSVKEQDMSSDTDSDDENATALGMVRDDPPFTPQPNAFSHPPSAPHPHRPEMATPYLSRPSHPAHRERASYAGRPSSRAQHSPYNAMSPAHRADHDEALRASLTTLLSCAAAARGLPKRNQAPTAGASPPARPEPATFRLVPESEVIGSSPAVSHPQSPSTRARSSPSISSQDAEKHKRKASAPSKGSTQSRTTKKKKFGVVEEAMITPTLLTWVVSAGVVVLVSVVGFGAGYVLGREVGRQEALSGIGDGAACGKEMVRGSGELRKFRWANARSIMI